MIFNTQTAHHTMKDFILSPNLALSFRFPNKFNVHLFIWIGHTHRHTFTFMLNSLSIHYLSRSVSLSERLLFEQIDFDLIFNYCQNNNIDLISFISNSSASPIATISTIRYLFLYFFNQAKALRITKMTYYFH